MSGRAESAVEAQQGADRTQVIGSRKQNTVSDSAGHSGCESFGDPNYNDLNGSVGAVRWVSR